MHEAAFWEEFYNEYSIFLTLTYDEANLPMYGTLVKHHVQDFLKRLRFHSGTKFRYYIVGEYGTTCPDHEIVDCPVCGPLHRPHYHGIFTWTPPDKEMLGSRDGMPVYESKIIEKAWGKGSHEFGSCTFESCAYVARYIMKKQTGNNSHTADHYCKYLPKLDLWVDLPPEFAIMSRRPGIGKPWLCEYVDDVYPSDEVPIPGRGVIGKPPRYYDSIYEKSNPTKLDEIKQKRRKAMAESLLNGPSLESRALVEDARLNLYKRS